MATRPIKGTYGVDAPWVPWLWFGLAAIFIAFGVVNLFDGFSVWYVVSIVYFLGGSLVWLIGGWLYLHTSLRGKFQVWARLLDDAHLKGTEDALDIGCGRGAVLVQVAQHVPHGHVTGIDLWRSVDQSGNSEAATQSNLVANGVRDRVTLVTGDMTTLPFADASFDLVTASLAVHNVRSVKGRASAIREAVRVLRPRGRLIIVDIAKVNEYQTLLTELGLAPTVTKAGWRMWWSGPWYGTKVLLAQK
jgi:arsenite methyltransferase